MSLDDKLNRIKEEREAERLKREKEKQQQIEHKEKLRLQKVEAIKRRIPDYKDSLVPGLIKIGDTFFEKPAVFASESRVNEKGVFKLVLVEKGSSQVDYSGYDDPESPPTFYKAVHILLTSESAECLGRRFDIENPSWNQDLLELIVSKLESGIGYHHGYPSGWELLWSKYSEDTEDNANVLDTNGNSNDTIWLILAWVFLLVFLFGWLNGYW